MNYQSVADTAKAWNLSERTVRNHCASGKIPGAVLTGKTWNIPQDAKRLRSAKRDAEPLCMSEDVPERSPRPAPGFPVGVLDLVGLSTYRRPADQR